MELCQITYQHLFRTLIRAHISCIVDKSYNKSASFTFVRSQTEHQTKTSHIIEWKGLKSPTPVRVGRQLEKDQGDHLHPVPETIFKQRQGLRSHPHTVYGHLLS